ncbi:hypothetical protein CYMTET_43896 [Cymbomonas tetramitiformis]|uniref:Uncharacterized protein n=1 Tax=Cymbomonas tetramitiformis TaxID=36881 RepID=A0AAE0C377_9CHLO|nr:hypothetical protein CYMTET_43896 [Cymbomonas tetramitiformis]
MFGGRGKNAEADTTTSSLVSASYQHISDGCQQFAGSIQHSMGRFKRKSHGMMRQNSLPANELHGLLKQVKELGDKAGLASGLKVKVYWPQDDAWYTGTVGDTGSDGLTHIAYEDGDKEDLDMSKERCKVTSIESNPGCKVTERPSNRGAKVTGVKSNTGSARCKVTGVNPNRAARYDLHLIDNIHISTGPGKEGSGIRWLRPALQYLPGEIHVEEGTVLPITCAHNTVRLNFFVEKAEYMHLSKADASFPRYHFNILADSVRNEAYYSAIQRVVGKLKAAGQEVHALDLGAGSASSP